MGSQASNQQTWPAPFHVVTVAETGSTNADLLAAGPQWPHLSVLVADHQTAGRGRLDRTWDSPPPAAPRGANLLCSILFRQSPGEPGYEPHALTQRVTVAAARACERVAGVSPGIKWPNDLLLGEAKLAGVLAQATSFRGVIERVVVGLGLNVGWAPPGAAHLPAGSRNDVLAEFLRELADLSPDHLGEYRRRLVTLGREVRVELPEGIITGQAVDVNADGALVLATPGGRRTIMAGDVIHATAQR